MIRATNPRPGATRVTWVVLVAGAALGACEHSTPFDVVPPDPLGPFETGSLVRLTFDPGEDRDASGRDSLVVYSHREASRPDGDWCLGVLPASGGTLLRMACPGSEDPDGKADAWLQASISPGGTRLAYVHQQSRAGSTSSESRSIVVAPLQDPGSGQVVVPSGYTLPDGRYANAFRQVRWIDETRLRFLAGVETLVRWQDQATGAWILDTVFTSFAVTDVAVSDGAMTVVPGTDSVDFHATAAEGIWLARGASLGLLPNGADSATWSITLPTAVLGLAAPDGVPLVIVRVVLDPDLGPQRVIAAVDTVTSELALMALPFEAMGLSHVPGARRLLVEGRAGGGTDVWRLELP